MAAETKKEIELDIGHVLFIDIVGYSKLLITEQSEQMEKLREIVRGTEQFRTAEAQGKLLRLPTGDGGALVFRNNLEAPVLCALEISKELKKHPELRVRMGIHSGPVNEITDLNQQANIAGAGINTAQRVMDCGDAGHILLSRHVAEDLEQYPRWRSQLHDLGECEVKHSVRVGVANLYSDEAGNPKLPSKFQAGKKHRTHVRWTQVAVGLVVAAAIAAATFLVSHRPVGSASAIVEKSIAVLPFENLSEEKANAFFADGVQDEILNDLGKVADLKVISRTSVMQYKTGAKRNLREIANALGVAHIVEGTVQRAANRVRVSAQLIDARTDAHVWAEHYDRSLDDVFAIQTEIAKAVADQLQAKLSPVEKAQINRKPTENSDAYLAFVQAHNLFVTGLEDLEKLKQSEQLYARAIELDPKFALAFARYSQLEDWIFHNYDPTRERREKARALAEQALQLQPDLPEAHLAMGFSLYYGDNDFEGGLKEFEIAQRGVPNDPESYLAVGAIQRRLGKWSESTASLEKAASLNPQDRWALQNLTMNYQMLRDFDAANKTVDRALQINPAGVELWRIKSRLAIAEKGDLSVAEKAFQTVQSMPMTNEEKLRIAGARADVFLLKRKYREGLREAENLPDDLLTSVPGALSGKYYLIGLIRKAIQDETGARAAFLKAKDLLEAQLKESPDAADFHIQLAKVLAYLGEKEPALAEARRATELLPESKDAFGGPEITAGVAEVYCIVGENGRAIELLDGLLSRPSAVTVPGLRLSLAWDPLRGDPRFQKLVASPAPK